MLVDPLPIARVTDTEFASFNADVTSFDLSPLRVSFAVTDLSPGSTKRVGDWDGNKAFLSISHSQSNENAPFVTDRSLIRIDLKKINTETGKTLTASAYVVIATPQGGDFTSTDSQELARTLGLFLLYGRLNSSGSVSLTDDSIPRILAGEP